MNGIGADSHLAQPPVGLEGMQDVRGLGCTVCDELVVFAGFPVGIIKVHVTHDVSSGGEDDQPGAPGRRELWNEESAEFEVPEMVCPDLQFEPVVSTSEG